MRTFLMLVVVGAGLLMTGCNFSTLFLSEAGTQEDMTADPALVGTWQLKEDKGLLVIAQGEGRLYKVDYQSGSDSDLFEGRLLKAGEARILELIPADDKFFHVPAHFFIRVWTGEKSMKLAVLNSDWFDSQAAGLASQKVRHSTVITAPASTIMDFLRKTGADEKAYNDVSNWERVK